MCKNKDRPEYDEYMCVNVAWHKLEDYLNVCAKAGWDVKTIIDRDGGAYLVLGR